MYVLKVLVLFAIVVQCSARWRFRGRTPRCLKITDKTAPLCVNLSQGYNDMMLPNLLDHDTVMEVRQELARWTPLVSYGCHQYLRHFLCSVYAPVCMPDEEPIKPCRSLCTMVRNSCEPVMKLHNYTWPAMLNCSRYAQDDVCISITGQNPTTPTPRQPSVCVDDDNIKFHLKKKFCEADFAFRGRIVERKERNGMLILKFKSSGFLKHSKALSREKILRVRVPVNAPSQCKGAQKRKQYLVLGTLKRGRKMVVTHLLRWKKWKKNARKLRGCK